MADIDSDLDLEDKVKDNKYIVKYQLLKEHLDAKEWFKANKAASARFLKGT